MRKRNRLSGSARTLLGLLLVLPVVWPGRLAAAPGRSREPSHGRVAAVVVPSGTGIPVTIDENVEVKESQIGHTFAGHITRNIVVNGAVAIPAGAAGELALVKNPNDTGSASFNLVRVSINGTLRPVRTDVGRADAPTHKGMSTGKKTGIGAAAGGVLGLILGGGSGLLKGAVVGAGGGLAWGLLDHGSHRVESGSSLLFTLRDSIQVG